MECLPPTTGASGELLKLLPGKKRPIYPVDVKTASTTPASIPLWYFDESNGLWKDKAVL